MRPLSFILALASSAVVLAVAGAAGAGPGDNAVVHWNNVATTTLLRANPPLPAPQTQTPSSAALYLAIVQAAVYNATMAIEGTHALYRSSLTAPSGASVDAAVAAAARDVLVTYRADQAGAVDGEYAAALAAIPDGQAKEDGIAAGRAAAAEMLARWDGDGPMDTSVPGPPDGDEPGEWKRTSGPNAVTPWTAQATPFLLESPDQFRPHGPTKLTSGTYADELEEVRLYGAAAGYPGLLRDDEQTEIARFWTENTVGQYNRALRGLAGERGLSTGEAARLFAMTALTGADAMITCWNTKYHYLGWRPVTAIREADTDGNEHTAVDPDWVPLSVTSNHPEHTSGHACLTGATGRALSKFLGTKKIDFTIDATIDGEQVDHHFATVKDLQSEVENARIYGGDHFRTGGAAGTEAGVASAAWSLKRFFRKT